MLSHYDTPLAPWDGSVWGFSRPGERRLPEFIPPPARGRAKYFYRTVTQATPHSVDDRHDSGSYDRAILTKTAPSTAFAAFSLP